jgi:hypothetical protein
VPSGLAFAVRPAGSADLLITIWRHVGRWRSMAQASRPMQVGRGQIDAVPLLRFGVAQRSPTPRLP